MQRLLAVILTLFRTGHGRPVAAAMLSGFALLILLPDYSPFKALRVELFDTYQTYLPRERKSAPVIIVGIDEASLKLLGQWPWPRTLLAELIDRIASFQPAAIGIDVIMPERDRASPARMAESWPQIDQAMRRRLVSLPDNDHILAAALKGRPIVLGVAGFDYQTPTTAATMRTAPILVRGGDAAPYLRHFPAVLKSLPELENAAAGQALLTVDLEKGVVRRLLLLAAVGETLVPTLSLEMLRVASGLPAIDVAVGPQGITSVGLGDVRIPTQANGEAWVHFAPFLSERYISAADLFSGRINPDRLKQKLVLIGLTGLGLLDFQTTPRGERVPGIEAHAQLLENVFDNSFLQRPAWMPFLELTILLLSGVFLLYAVPALKPRFSTMLAAIFAGSLLGLGFLLYHTTGLLFDAASLSMSLNTVFASLLGSVFIETDRAKIAAQTALQIERVAAAYMAGELEAAQRIQMGSLPKAAHAFPGENRFALDALLEPAREVGGDLYDFYMLDHKRLFFIVGDVAGKGLPASLFMVMTKALMKSIVTNNMLDLGQTLKRLNNELVRENPETLFVTVFAAILDTDQGVLDYCIAGHDAPWRIAASGAVNQLTGEGNPPLSVMEDIDYPLEKVQLSPGDAICVVTDGITEAMNAGGELYGRTRPIELLERKGGDLSVTGLLALLRDDVRNFVGNAEQSDDLTSLIVRWYGPPGL